MKLKKQTAIREAANDCRADAGASAHAALTAPHGEEVP